MSIKESVHLLLGTLIMALMAGLVRLWFPALGESQLITIILTGLSTTLLPHVFFVLAVRRSPTAAAAFVLGGIFMRLTALAIISIWLRVKHPEELRAGLLAFLVFVAAFLVYEIVALPAFGFHRLRANGDAKQKTSGPTQ